jgi:hypothetical protein
LKTHTEILWQLATALFSNDEQKQLRALTETGAAFDAVALYSFDESIGGPCMTRMNYSNNEGRYAIADRNIFRPLQYCGKIFGEAIKSKWDDHTLWRMRYLVEMSSAHIEALVKQIGNVLHLPLGPALRNAIVRTKVDRVTWGQIDIYTHIYNDAKHNFGQDKDTHMFSVEDAVLAYFVCRRLGEKLYPLANLMTDMKVFDEECEEKEGASKPWWAKYEGEHDRSG